MTPRFSIKALLLFCTIVAVTVAVWQRNTQTISHADSVRKIKSTAYYGYVLPRPVGWLFGFHFVARVTEVQLRHIDFKPSYNRPEMIPAKLDKQLFATLKSLPDLKTVWLFDDTEDRKRYNRVKSELADIDVINVIDFPDSRPSLANGTPFSILHAVGIISITLILSASFDFVFNRRK